MKKILAALAVGFFMWPSPAVSAKSVRSFLLIQWLPYQQGSAPAEKLRLYRSVNGGPFRLHETISNFNITQIQDRDVKWQREYCYKLFAVTSGGRESLPSSVVCARPIK